MMTLRLLAVAPALSAYLLASAPRGSLHHARMSLVDGESVAALPAGLEKEVLRSPLPSAQPCKTGDIALVHFTVSKADGTLLHDSRTDEGEPLEFSVGVQPSEVVSQAAGSPRLSPGLLRQHPRTAQPTRLPATAAQPHASPRLPGARLGLGHARHARGGGCEAAVRPRVRVRSQGRTAADPAARDADFRRGAATAAQPDGQQHTGRA